MNLCWIAPREGVGHARDVQAAGRAQLLRDDYEEFRLTCDTPSGTKVGSLYIQAGNAGELASHAAKCGWALFGGCTTMQLHRLDGTAMELRPDAEVAAPAPQAHAVVEPQIADREST